MGMTNPEILRVAENSFAVAFLPLHEKAALCKRFRRQSESLGLL
jgi:hypothetical protein